MSTAMPLEDTAWHEDAVDMIRAFAASGLTFTAEDIRRSFRPAPHANAYGTAFRAARTLGIITAHGFRESSTPSRKGGVIRVWSAAPTLPTTKERDCA